MIRSISFLFDRLPPTSNHMTGHGRRGAWSQPELVDWYRLKPTRMWIPLLGGVEYLGDLHPAPFCHVSVPCTLDVVLLHRVVKTPRRFDGDNRCKAAQDWLVRNGYLEDDSLIGDGCLGARTSKIRSHSNGTFMRLTWDDGKE